ncbi:hypothetical protein [Geminicoccus roseus]|uniref:hypothetical protein n=1 Tax=Geminicoccus roseus TaxID=404900 RepID=UPI00041FA431|nr:hypothetical protein [Geminicoccus roseus]
MFVDRHFYERDAEGRGRYVTLTRGAQIRLALVALLLVVVPLGLAAGLVWTSFRLPGLPGTQAAAIVRPQAPPVAEPARTPPTDETAALRAALDESRQKRAELVAELENLKRQQQEAPSGPTQADLDRLQALLDEAVNRAGTAEARADAADEFAAAAVEEAEAARREALSRAPIDEASVPDRIRALELELEAARAENPPPPVLDMEMALTPEEQMSAERFRELDATIAELEAERDMLEQRIAELTDESDQEDPPSPSGSDPVPGPAASLADREGSDPDDAHPAVP